MIRGCQTLALVASLLACAVETHAQEKEPLGPETTVDEELPAEATLNPRSRSGMSALGGMGGKGGSGGPGYSASWFPSRQVNGDGEQLSILRQNLSLGVPVWRAEGSMLLLNTGIRSTIYETEAALPVSGRQIPEQLWSISFGTMFMHRFENGWNGAVMVSVGSSGDKPFNSWNDMNATVLAFLTVPSGERNSWMFSMFYSPLSQIPFPIPGIAYSWNVDDSLQISLGIPFRVSWKPLPDVFVEASYMPVTVVHFETGWRVLGGPVTVFGGYDWTNEAYQLSDRSNHKDRFFSYAMTLSGGLRYDLPKYGSIELLGGYAFDRFLYIGQGFSDRNNDRIDIDAGPFLGTNFKLRF